MLVSNAADDTEALKRLDQLAESAPAGALLGGRHAQERVGQVRLTQNRADLRGLATGQEDLRRGRPGRELVALLGNVAVQRRVDDEALLAELDRRLDHLAEGELAVAGQRRQPAIGRAGDDRALYPDRDLATLALQEVLQPRRAAPIAQSGDGDEIAARLVVDDQRRDPAEAAQVGQQHIDADAGRDPGIDGVAASAEHAHPRFSRQVMA